ncbi:uncharacterized protein LOC132698408 [Cylas formicarius]|uniref:uncharacterized protein LOC132698408 n=1 Tax=Cylas formicarius TaxID=197179 RepID=UPI0029583A39|nr:uncharacterized protein LOC132698408 [Cylas formicarius]
MDFRNKLIVVVLGITWGLGQVDSSLTIFGRNANNPVNANVLNNNDATFPSSSCCIVPTCKSSDKCYQTLSCGYLCSSGKYPPAEYSRTPGYRLKETYSKYDCRFGDCRFYEFTCSHCPDPLKERFSIYLIRDDCRECYFI